MKRALRLQPGAVCARLLIANIREYRYAAILPHGRQRADQFRHGQMCKVSLAEQRGVPGALTYVSQTGGRGVGDMTGVPAGQPGDDIAAQRMKQRALRNDIAAVHTRQQRA